MSNVYKDVEIYLLNLDGELLFKEPEFIANLPPGAPFPNIGDLLWFGGELDSQFKVIKRLFVFHDISGDKNRSELGKVMLYVSGIASDEAKHVFPQH